MHRERYRHLSLVAAAGLAVLACVPGRVPAQERKAASASDVLLLHGVNPTTDSILLFLRNGFPPDAITRGLPAEPKDKTQVLIDAIQELGARRTPQAVDLLMQMCRGQFPPGVRQVTRFDLEGLDALLVTQRQTRLQEFVIFNSMVALGWIGDPKAVPVVLDLMKTQKPTGYTTQGALALAMMGNADGLPGLVKLMQKGDPGDQAGAARVLYCTTGRYYSLGPNSSVAKRKAIIKDLETWWKDWEGLVQVNPDEVRRRRLGPYPPNPEPVDLESVPGLCRASTNILGNYETSFRARQKLNSLGRDGLPDLEKVARDEMEDNDVRLEAIRVCVLIAGKDSKPLLKDLDGDHNKPVADRATYILKHFDQFLKATGKP